MGATMHLVIAAVLFILTVCFFIIFLRSMSSGSASSKDKTVPTSKTPIDLSVFDKICRKEGDNGKIDFWPLPESDNSLIKDMLSQLEPLTPELLKRIPSVKIAYLDSKDIETIRDIIPYRVVGSIDYHKDGPNEYDFYIEAYCLLRNEERSFHVNGISAAWHRGSEINLGDYLADLYRKSKKR
jgi:hypothetical protein